MCQQSVEKALKALYTKIYKEIPPKTHSLSYLIDKIGIEEEMSDYFSEIVDKLEPLNIEARYPTYKDEIFELLTKEYCQTIYKQTSELLIWIKSKL
ncbi:MAG: HEPN domain-containing protein [Candidatus Kapabacteria bacterium]|nr:HEPN domain-containing protein [Candidatus Kapabacteria bacterium]